MQSHTPQGDLNREAQDIWDANAAYWDARMGEGNDFQRYLVGPATERLLALRPGEEVLEIACGNGVMARRMAQLGAKVLATDCSPTFLEKARARTVENADRIEYRLVDATDRAQLLALGRLRFDAAVCSMALMDMAEIDPLAEALPDLLKPEGRFVFSVVHPCFNNPSTRKAIEEEDREGHLITTRIVSVCRYARPFHARGLGMVGQPVPQIYFHRPINVLFGAFFRTGFVLDGLEEPTFPPEAVPDRSLSWNSFPEIPPVLVARMRRWGAPLGSIG